MIDYILLALFGLQMLAFVVSLQAQARIAADERARLVNHLLAEKPHEYVALQRADAQSGKDPRPNRPEKIHPEGL